MARIEEIVDGVIARAEVNPVFRNLLEKNTLEVLQAEGITFFTADLFDFLGQQVDDTTGINAQVDMKDQNLYTILLAYIQNHYPQSVLLPEYRTLSRPKSPHC